MVIKFKKKLWRPDQSCLLWQDGGWGCSWHLSLECRTDPQQRWFDPGPNVNRAEVVNPGLEVTNRPLNRPLSRGPRNAFCIAAFLSSHPWGPNQQMVAKVAKAFLGWSLCRPQACLLEDQRAAIPWNELLWLWVSQGPDLVHLLPGAGQDQSHV